MTCYKGGETVFNNHQMCNVTSELHRNPHKKLLAYTHTPDRKILDMLPNRPPQVTFSCDVNNHTCAFQFWTAEVESFFCALDQCESKTKIGYESKEIFYNCKKMKCSCVPGRFICGEDGSVGKWCF